MKKYIALIFAAILLVSCGASVTDVKSGMTGEEVKEILGEPTNVTESNSSAAVDGGTSVEVSGNATWTYEGMGVVNFTDGKVVSVYEKK